MLMMFLLTMIFVVGTIYAIARSGREMHVPWDKNADPLAVRRIIHRYVWYVTLAVGAGISSGIIMIGFGGRLAMRVLAVTGGASAQGRITEAEEIVGAITLDGTIGFILFNGLIGGIFTGLLFVAGYRWLPRGRWRGPIFGLLLMIVFASRIEPLRSSNPDFDIVGPGWLSILLFTTIAVLHGVMLDAVTTRYSRSLPVLPFKLKESFPYAPLLILLPGFPLLVPIVLGGLITVAVMRIAGTRRLPFEPLLWGRVLIIAVASVSLPGFLSATIDIVGRA